MLKYKNIDDSNDVLNSLEKYRNESFYKKLSEQ